MEKFNLDTAQFVMGMWTDEEGNRITDSEYNQILSASTWNDLDPEDLFDDPGQVPYEETLSEDDFREYIMGINL